MRSSTGQPSVKHWHAQSFQSKTIWKLYDLLQLKAVCHLQWHATLKRYNYKKNPSQLTIQGLIMWVNEFFHPTPLVFKEDENWEPCSFVFALHTQYFCHVLGILFGCLFLEQACWKRVRQQIIKLLKISHLSQQRHMHYCPGLKSNQGVTDTHSLVKTHTVTALTC